MQAILCSRGKGGGCRVVDIPVAEMRDLFGRTEAELVASIAREERLLVIRSYYTGSEGLGINLRRDRAALDVDKRCLAELRGERVERDEPIRLLSGDALAKWRKNILSMGYR